DESACGTEANDRPVETARFSPRGGRGLRLTGICVVSTFAGISFSICTLGPSLTTCLPTIHAAPKMLNLSRGSTLERKPKRSFKQKQSPPFQSNVAKNR